MSLGGGQRTSISGSSTGARWSIASTWMKLSPRVRGICGFTCAITVLAASAAGFAQSTEIPRLQNPALSGGDTWIMATSSGSVVVNSPGASDRKTGV